VKIKTYHNGSFSFEIVSSNINKSLSNMGLTSEKDSEITHIGLCSSQSMGWKSDKKCFYVCAWEVSSVMQRQIDMLNGDLMVGISKYVEDCYNSCGYNNTCTAMLGCDHEFWKPIDSIKKRNNFTVLCHTSSNSRSGLDVLIPAFAKYFKKKEISLYIKDSSNEGNVKSLVSQYNEKYGCDIIYDNSFMTDLELRELYNSCHCHIYPTYTTGFGMTITQTLSCGLPNIVSNYSACPEIVNSEDVGYLIEGEEIDLYVEDLDAMLSMGIINHIPLAGYVKPPKWFRPNPDSICYNIERVLENYSMFDKKNLHNFVKENFCWSNTCKSIHEALQEKE